MTIVSGGTGNAGVSQASADATYAKKPTFQTASPTTGQTVVMTDDDTDGTLYITPAGALAALTITFPSDANSRVGQWRRVACTKAVAALTLGGVTVLNATSSLIINDCFTFEKITANTWILLQ